MIKFLENMKSFSVNGNKFTEINSTNEETKQIEIQFAD